MMEIQERREPNMKTSIALCFKMPVPVRDSR